MKDMLWDRLKEVLKYLCVPPYIINKKDINWINRNLSIKNNKHPRLREAMDLVKKIIKENKNE